MRRYGKRPPPPPRSGKTDTLRRLARLARERESEEFDPERPRERYARPHHFAVNRGHRRNHHHSLSGGLHEQPELLRQFVEMAAESIDEPGVDPEKVDVTDEVYRLAKEYDAALASVLDEIERGFPAHESTTADDLWDAEGPYLVLMTLRGEGVGIWDEWDRFFNKDELDKVQSYLEERLGRFADVASGGLLDSAFVDAAYETGGGDHEPNTALGPQWSPNAVRLRWTKTNGNYHSQSLPGAGGRAYSLDRRVNRWDVSLGSEFVGEVVNLKEAKELARQHYRINIA